MTTQHDLDRILDDWLHRDATMTPPAEPLARAIDSTRLVRPRTGLIARIGSAWIDADGTRFAGGGLRPALMLALVTLLAVMLAGGALLVGSRLLSNPINPWPLGPARNGVIAFVRDGGIVVADRPGGELRPLGIG